MLLTWTILSIITASILCLGVSMNKRAVPEYVNFIEVVPDGTGIAQNMAVALSHSKHFELTADRPGRLRLRVVKKIPPDKVHLHVEIVGVDGEVRENCMWIETKYNNLDNFADTLQFAVENVL